MVSQIYLKVEKFFRKYYHINQISLNLVWLLLEHHSLSNRYTLTNPDSSITEDFATLTETLDFLKQYTKTVVLPGGVNPNDALQMRLQVSLSRGDLPGPLKLVALFLKDWRLGSDWERWKVTIP